MSGDTDPDDTIAFGVTPPTDVLAGHVLGERYLFVSRLGRGGMGEVWRAYETKLQREVAVKLVRVGDGLANASLGARERLLREARALARLAHPNVVTVFDAGDAGENVFVAMELVEGKTLAAWRATLPGAPAILEAFLAAGAGLAAAHRKGIVHGDFKPENVMVDAEGRVRVLDFGLARFLGAPDTTPLAASPDATGPRAALAEEESPPDARTPPADMSTEPRRALSALRGTPRYMAPEQWLGRSVDARTDQYAFCVALYESLHGHHPILSDDDETQRAPYRVPKGLARGEAIAAALQRGLAQEPAGRFDSMEALLHALRPRSRKPWVWPAIAAGAALVAAFALVPRLRPASPCAEASANFVGIWDDATRGVLAARFDEGKGPTGSLFPHFEARVNGYVERWLAMQQDACLATRVRGVQSERLLELRMACLERRRHEVQGLLSQVREMHTPPQLARAVDAVGSLASTDACADGEALSRVRWPEAPAQRAAAASLIDRLDELRGRLNVIRADLKEAEAKPLLEEAQRLGHVPLVAEAHLILGSAQAEAGHFREAMVSFEAATQEAAEARSDELSARAWVALLNPVGALEERDRFFTLEPVARAAIVRLGGDARLANMVDRETAWHFMALGRLEEARQRYAQAAAVAHTKPSLRDFEGAALDGLGCTLRFLGRYDEAEKQLREALQMLTEAVGPDHPRVATTLNNLADTLGTQGRYDEAIALLRRSEGITEVFLARDNPDRALAPFNLGATQRMRGQFAEARATILRAKAIFEGAYGPANSFVGMCVEELGKISLQEGDARTALDLFEQTLAIFERSFGPDNWYTSSAHQDLALALLALHRPREADAHAQLALAVATKEKVEPVRQASAEICAAKAAWEIPARRGEALPLARQARDRLAPLAPSFADERKDIATWLAGHEPAAR